MNRELESTTSSKNYGRFSMREASKTPARFVVANRRRAAMREKLCSVCQRALPFTSFHRRGHDVRAGIRAACKDCTRDATRRAQANRPKSDPQKRKVRAQTRHAIRRGELTPSPCRMCGAQQVQPHHPRYEGADAHLEVIWLCRVCHARIHGRRAWTRQLELFPREDLSVTASGVG
jgi:hypothetical protein